jgi:AraC-like DNA-binding protein
VVQGARADALNPREIWVTNWIMSETIPPFTPLHISTDGFPPHRRLQMWCEAYECALASFYGREVGRLEIEPLDDRPFRAGITLRSFPGLGIASGYRSDARYHRTRDLAAKSSDNLMFAVVTNGFSLLSQRQRETTLGPGEASLVSATEPSISTMQCDGRMLTLSLPRGAIAPLVRNVEDAIMRPIPRRSAALRLLISYAGFLQSDMPAEASLRPLVGNHIYDLVAATIGAIPDAMQVARGRGIRAARLATVRADVLANLRDPRLSAKVVGHRHGVTDRYIHRLFEEAGETFATFVERERIRRALALLTDPAKSTMRIVDIALAVGYAEHSTFDRAFRRCFGDTPRAVRSGHRHELSTSGR